MSSIKKKCEICNSEFETKFQRVVCCSSACKKIAKDKKDLKWFSDNKTQYDYKNCVICNKEFVPYRPRDKYCSTDCFKEHQTNKPKFTPTKISCQQCGSLFTALKSTDIYCRRECRKEYNRDIKKARRVSKKIKVICEICNKSFVAEKKTTTVCGKACSKKKRLLKHKNITVENRKLIPAINCAICNKSFVPYRPIVKYCGKVCAKIAKGRQDGFLPRFSTMIRITFRKILKSRDFTKKSRTTEMLGCSFEYLHQHLIQTAEKNYGLYCDSWKYHIDHIVPCHTAKTEEELVKLQHYTNLQYLTQEDNLNKGKSLDWTIEKSITKQKYCLLENKKASKKEA